MDNYLFRRFNVNDKGSTTIYLDHKKFTGNWIIGYMVANDLQHGKRYNKFVIKLIGSYYLILPLIALVMPVLTSLMIITHTY